MKRQAILVGLFLSFMVQSVDAQENVVSGPKSSRAAAWLAWFKSLRLPTENDIAKVQEYLQNKWRCLRYGENCSRKEREKLIDLSMATTISLLGLISLGFIKKSNQKVHKKDNQKMGTVETLESIMRRDGASELEKLIKQGLNPNSTMLYKGSSVPLLIVAAHKGGIKILNALLKAGVDPNQVAYGKTALIVAALSLYNEKQGSASHEKILTLTQIINNLLDNKQLDLNKYHQGARAFAFILESSGASDILYPNIVEKFIQSKVNLRQKIKLTRENEPLSAYDRIENAATKKDNRFLKDIYKKIRSHRKMTGKKGYKVFSEVFIPGKSDSPLRFLPEETKGSIFEYVTEQELTPKQRAKLMERVKPQE